MKTRLIASLFTLTLSASLSFLHAQTDIDLTGYTQSFDEEFNSLSVTASSPKGTSTWFDWPPYGSAGAYSNSIWDINAFSVTSNVLSDKAWIVTGQDEAGVYSGGPVSMIDGSGTSVVTAVTPGTAVNSHSNFQWDGYVGMKFTTGSSGMVVSKLGRYVYSGNTQTHDLKLIDAATGADVPNSVVTVATSGATAGTFVYASLASNITLQASHSYYLLSHEGNGGTGTDYWYSGASTTVTTTSEITVNGSEWGEWHSGNLSSMDSTGAGFGQQYGYFETYCQMPSSGTGAWTSFWLETENGILNNNNGTSLPNEEIDIFEWYGSAFTANQSVVEQHNHNWTPSGGPAGLAASAEIPGGALPWQGYHVYGCQVDPLYITWYIDGVAVNQIATPTGYITSPLYMMFDYAVGGGWPSTGMVNPSTFSSKWIRAYSLPTWPFMYDASAEGTQSVAFSYQIQTVNSATSYTASSLPPGLKLNTTNGVISGTPVAAGIYTVPVTATNANGTGSSTLTLAISSGLGIGIQFQGTGTATPTTSSAGIPGATQVNWNVLTGSSFSSAALVNNTGTTTTATISGTAAGTSIGGKITAPPTGNATLTSGVINDGATLGAHVLTVSNVPYPAYDVYIYADLAAAGRNETVSLTPSGGTAQYYSFATEDGGSVWTAATSTWNGTGTAPTLPSANYVVYRGLTASSFSTTWAAPGNGEVNAIQIVPEAPTVLYVSGSTGITLNGTWTQSTYDSGYYGGYYLVNGASGTGVNVVFTPNLPATATYEVYAWWTADSNRGSTVPVSIVTASGTENVQVDQQTNGSKWVSLGTYSFNAGTGGSVTLGTTGANGDTIANAVEFVPQ